MCQREQEPRGYNCVRQIEEFNPGHTYLTYHYYGLSGHHYSHCSKDMDFRNKFVVRMIMFYLQLRTASDV